MVQLQQYLFLAFDMIHLLLLDDVNLLHDFQCEDFPTVAQANELDPAERAVAQCCDDFE